ncbi:hypothetical protein, partial [Pantoea agglomerans]|uniref:hypothetical protein n=1 Tax=Enterobacter agglomerans TaxID=549 RepID=UPI001A8E33C7
ILGHTILILHHPDLWKITNKDPNRVSTIISLSESVGKSFVLADHGLAGSTHLLGSAQPGDRFVIRSGDSAVYSESRNTLR